MKAKELKLDPHQTEGVRIMNRLTAPKSHKSVLHADDMGLGKTVQGIAWMAQNKDKWPVLIVCPANAKYVWEEHIHEWIGIRPVIIEGNYKQGRPELRWDPKIVIINYDVLDSWVDALQKHKFKSILMDEAHYFSNTATRRYHAIRRLCLQEFRHGEDGSRMLAVRPRIRHRIAMTGTPMTNRPADLWAILSILWPWKFMTPYKFLWKFCTPHKIHGRWVFNGAKNLDVLHRMLYSLGTIRRMKGGTYKNFPKKERIPLVVDLRRREEYDFADRDFLKWLSGISLQRAKRAKRAEAITRMMYLLRLSAKLRMRHIGKWIDEFLSKNKGKKLVVFSYITPLLKALKNRYGEQCVLINGSVRGRDRQAAIKHFQTSKVCRLAVCHGKAVGVAVTLHAAHHMLCTDLPRSPSVLIQAEDRIWRRGQKFKCDCYYMLGRNTYDMDVLKSLLAKQRIMDRVMSGKVSKHQLESLDQSVEKMLLNKISKKLHR